MNRKLLIPVLHLLVSCGGGGGGGGGDGRGGDPDNDNDGDNGGTTVNLSQGWNREYRISSSSAFAYDVSLFTDANGEATAVWAENNSDRSRVTLNYFLPGWENWDGPQAVHDLSDSFTVEKPMVGFDADGDGIVVWYQAVGTPPDQEGSIVARRYVAGDGWQDSRTLQAFSDPNPVTPILAMAPSGQAVIVWYRFDDNNIWTVLYSPESGWASPEAINSDPSDGFAVDIDSSGNVMVLWQQYEGDFSDNFPDIVARRHATGAGWEAPVLLEQGLPSDLNAYNPDIGMDSAGNGIAIWQGNNGDASERGTYFNFYTAGVGWSDAQLLVEDASQPRLAVNAGGGAVAVWNFQSNSALQGVVYTPGFGWSDPVTIDSTLSGADINDKDIAISDAGTAFVVWTQMAHPRESVWANRYQAGVGWGQPAVLEFNDSADAFEPKVVVDGDNNALFVWSFGGFSFGSQVWASIFIE